MGITFNPHKEEISRAIKKLRKALDVGDYHEVSEQSDRYYTLLFDTSLIYAEGISKIKEILEGGKLEELAKKEGFSPEQIEESKKIAEKSMNSIIADYQEITKMLRGIREIQQKYGLTNAPID